MSAKEQTKNRVAIAGQVIDAETEVAIPGVLVEITQMPEKFKNWLDLHALQYGKSWEKIVKRPDKTLTAVDGCFCLINLPDGEYTLLTIQVSAQGYKPVDRSVKLSQSETLELQNFQLTPEDKPKVK
ncbi:MULTISPECIES: carboxypeptidase regulatory-like domain-containing protein [unclassified Microcoleus]|uniref:carboxypeptidase regulatory-like domain-containing protein n=1 Tax=unclassified Microcoleus TaxID=2642155 RepID=UPI002FCF744E